MVNKVLEGKGNYGYNAATGEYGDMLDIGVVDPTKVTRVALQNAASVAGLMLTTACMVAELPEDEPARRYGRRGHGRHGWNGRHDVIKCGTCSQIQKDAHDPSNTNPAQKRGLFFIFLFAMRMSRYNARFQEDVLQKPLQIVKMAW